MLKTMGSRKSSHSFINLHLQDNTYTNPNTARGPVSALIAGVY
jgi:hypothetical protein